MKKTIKDIARMTNVSPATVSKVINNYSDVSDATREKVLKAMDDVGYESISLLKKSKNLVAIIYGVQVAFNHPFFSEVISTISKELGEFGYDIVFFSSNDDDTNYLTKCKETQVAACVVIGGDENHHSIYDLDHSDIPCIGIDVKLQGDKSGYLMSDNINIGKKVVEHFYLLGHREIVYIGGKQHRVVGIERTAGFIQAMREFGLPVNEKWIAHGDFSEKSGYDVMKEFLSQQEKVPSALFAASDTMAFGAITAIKERGLKIPDDIGIIGCDDLEISKYIAQPLTTIRQDKNKMGKLAAQMLMDMMNGIMGSSSVTIDSDLIVRESCGAKKSQTII